MGQEIDREDFSEADFHEFRRRLAAETAILQAWLESGHLDEAPAAIGGFEVEAWLIDPQTLRPAPRNRELIERADDPLLTPELARFNIELNTTPEALAGDGLERMHAEMQATWERLARTAGEIGCATALAGILPSARHADFGVESMSDMTRYRALNRQLLRLREGRLPHLDIRGREHLELDHPDVMLEAAATSFQIHLQVPASRIRRFFNASMIASGPLLAAGANSPYLFGRDLWAETRVPLFEQAVELGTYALRGPLKRVTFGSDYIAESPLELFRENLEHYPPLLPILFDDPPERLAHLRLHNGTIWRWNRPLVGVDGTPHLRLEQRVCPAGPTLADQVANAAFFFGLAQSLADRPFPPAGQLEFAHAKQNLYQCARHGLAADVH